MLLEGVAEEVSLSSLCLELCYHYRVCVFWCFLIVIGEAAARGERAEGSVATGTPLLPQRLAAQRICRILRARRYGSQRKLFPSFRGAAVRYSQRFYFPPPPLYANRAWWRLAVPLTGLEYERLSEPLMIRSRIVRRTISKKHRGVALRFPPALPPLRWGEWPGSRCTVASEVAGVAWVSKEPRPKKKEANPQNRHCGPRPAPCPPGLTGE